MEILKQLIIRRISLLFSERRTPVTPSGKGTVLLPTWKESVNHVSECLVNSAAGTAIRNKGSFPILSPPDIWVRSPTCYFPGKIKSAKEQATSIHSLASICYVMPHTHTGIMISTFHDCCRFFWTLWVWFHCVQQECPSPLCGHFKLHEAFLYSPMLAKSYASDQRSSTC